MKRLTILLTAVFCLACAGLPGVEEPVSVASVAEPADPAIPDNPTVAILYFDYEGEDKELGSLKKGLAQMIITDMAGNAGYDVVERDRLEDILKELELSQSDKIDPKKAVEIGKLVGADLTIMGSYFEAMGAFRVDTRIVDTATSIITCGVGETGKRDDFLGIQSRLSDKLSVAVLSDGDDCTSPLPSKPPPAPALERKTLKRLDIGTAATFSQALEAKDSDDPAKAKALLDQVVKAEPEFKLAADELATLMM